MKSAAQKMYESWQHHHPSRCSIPPWHKATPEARAEWEARAANPAEPAPASTGRETEEDFKDWMRRRGPLGAGAVPERIFFAGHSYGSRSTPVAAPELDVEAERLIFEAAMPTVYPRDRNMPDKSYNSPQLHERWQGWMACAAARSAAQSTAPVSTEQAGDAWISVEDRLPKNEELPNGDWPSVLCLWKEGELDAGLVQVMVSNTAYFCKNVEKFTHWMELPSLPSPNNSPVGADKEPK